jgi:D-alanyl-D-alanine carboxypeptidase
MKATWKQAMAATTMALIGTGCGGGGPQTPPHAPLPPKAKQVTSAPRYQDSTWSLRLVDLQTQKVLLQTGSTQPVLIGSVRKLFSVGLALSAMGAERRFTTPLYSQGGPDASGTLAGDLVMVASADMGMGGRTLPNGELAIPLLDHNEANILGNATLPPTDPLAGFRSLARQLKEAGVRRILGEVIVDDRLFEPFNFRDEFHVTPMFVNDNVVDVSITPSSEGEAEATVDIQPRSALFPVIAQVRTERSGWRANDQDTVGAELVMEPNFPNCLGRQGCEGRVVGRVAQDLSPPLHRAWPWVQTFRITDPSTFGRAVLIEALRDVGIELPQAQPIALNPVGKLPAPSQYVEMKRLAALESPSYAQFARHILKVSYNIGADTSLMLFGVHHGVRRMDEALKIEQQVLKNAFGIHSGEYAFPDGSGGGESRASAAAVIAFLNHMKSRPEGQAFTEALPALGVDGSLALVNAFLRDPALAGAQGQVQAKTGTFIEQRGEQLYLRTHAMAGYITARSGRKLAYMLALENLHLPGGIDDMFEVMQDQGQISAALWQAY